MNIPCLSALYHPEIEVSPWQFAADDVDFSLEPRYETPRHEKFDPTFAPFWNEPVEALTDPSVRQVTILKPSRAGCTEGTALNALRYHAAIDPCPMYYLGAQQESVERFFEERIVLGLKCSRKLRAQANTWRVVGTRIVAPAWHITAGYPGNKSSDKQFGYALVVIDEASLCQPGTVKTLLKRMDTYRDGHMLVLSSPDAKQKKPSDEDAIFIEYENGDKREWHCVDPKTGNLFVFRLGGRDTDDGVKWDEGARDENGVWDMERVAKTAHYVTPDGTRIDNVDRMAVVRTGKWLPTNTSKSVDPSHRSYHIDALCLPFINGDFGHYAKAWLTAVKDGQDAIRTFRYEFEARPFHGQQKIVEDSIIPQRQAKYAKGTRISVCPVYNDLYAGRRSLTVCTVDVQKESLWWNVREWFEGGDSALVDFGNTERWEVVSELVVKHGVRKTFIDQGYKDRRNEVFDQCLTGCVKNAVPTFGRDQLHMPYEVKERDPFSGTAKQGRHSMAMVTFNPDQIKHILYNEIQNSGGHSWMVYDGIENIYNTHMTAEKCEDGKWVAQHKRNHEWDCEVMQLVGAMVLGVYHQVDMTELINKKVSVEVKKDSAKEPKKEPEKKIVGPVCPACGQQDYLKISASQLQCKAVKKTGQGKCMHVWTLGQNARDRWGDDDE